MDLASTRAARRTRPCPRCRYENLPWATACSSCGHALPRANAGPGPRSAPIEPRIRHGAAPPWAVLGIGAFLAPALGTLPILRYMGWFLASLVHEIGHCAAAWLSGMPAYPAIRIDGHAAAMHSDQRSGLVLLVWCILVALAWQVRRQARWRRVAVAALLLYPVLALTSAHEILHLIAGHLGELAFGGVFFYRALSGGFTESTPERIMYALCAWFLVGRNVVLDVGLLTDEAARAAYAGNGSFGLTQDFVRAARALGWSLPGVAGGMLLLSLAALPLAWWLWRRQEGMPTAAAHAPGAARGAAETSRSMA